MSVNILVVITIECDVCHKAYDEIESIGYKDEDKWKDTFKEKGWKLDTDISRPDLSIEIGDMCPKCKEKYYEH